MTDIREQVFQVLDNMVDQDSITIIGPTIDLAMKLTDPDAPFDGLSFTVLVDPINEWRKRNGS